MLMMVGWVGELCVRYKRHLMEYCRKKRKKRLNSISGPGSPKPRIDYYDPTNVDVAAGGDGTLCVTMCAALSSVCSPRLLPHGAANHAKLWHAVRPAS